MGRLRGSMARGEVTAFSRSNYEVVFSIFMIAVAYFYRHNPQIVYPTVLYFFLLLLVSNLAFSRLLRERRSVNPWLIDLILVFNFWVITGVIYYSGKGGSYFWVLYLLPIFGAALMASFKDAAGIVLLCVLGAGVMGRLSGPFDIAWTLTLMVKTAVFSLSAWVVYRTAAARKSTEAELEERRREAERLACELEDREAELVRNASTGELGKLVSGIMHDLGNSVSVMLLTSQIIREEDNPSKKDIDRIIRAARFSKGIISNAMGLVRGQEYVFEEGRISEAIENAVALLGYSAAKRGIVLNVSVQDGLPCFVMSKVHMERAFLNMINNAISVTPDGGEVSVRASQEGELLAIYVADSGPGFPERLLKEGIRAFSTTRREKGGTGLGLFVTEQIVRKHGGDISLSNRPSGGAQISIRLPFRGKGCT